ncbi:MAG: uroporphyrinogen decarboxylase family protein [Eggerthellaceae bacterium]|nr:uroporphyrinogen decarboxylase family protein [Eggerthellaceae bacterium]
MDMRKWVAETIAADKKKALPVLSFPAIQPLGITVKDLINDSVKQAEAMRLVAERCDTAASVSFMDLSVEAEAFGSKIVVSDDEVPTVVGSIVDEDSDPDDLEVPEVGAGRTKLYLDAIENAVKEITDRPVLAGCIGPFSLAGRLMDVSEIMILCYEEPELVHAVLDKATQFIIGYANAFKERGANGVLMAEPLAGLLSPDLAEEFSAKYCKQVVDAVQTDEFGVFYHNCGNGVVKTVDSIIANGAMGYHFGNAINMADILPLMPKDVLVMGNVDPAGQLRNGTPESVYAKTTEILKECSQYPNFVISTGCDVPPMSPWENIDAFFKAVADFNA